jgi:uncharacterized protein YgiM (DUF1202 family)
MRYLKRVIWVVIFQTLPLLLYSCAMEPAKIDSYYSIPTISYLRECPNYDCQVVSEIYNANKVKVIQKIDTGWWQVQSARDEQIGWIQGNLLSDIPIIPQNYYVAVDLLPLRDSPSEDIVSRKLLSYGDEVQKLTEKEGWWRVIAEKDKAIGWVPAKMVSATQPESPEKPPESGETSPESLPPSKTPYYFVASENVKLHLIPDTSSQVVKELKLNDKVEKISQSGTTWIKVRYPGTGAEGWAATRYFKDSPVTKKNQIVTKKKKFKKAGVTSRQSKRPLESAPLEPEGM